MKSLLVYLKDYKKETVLGPLFKLLEASFELIVPLVVASMIDVGIAGHDKGYVVKMCLIMAALGVTGLISSVTAQFFAAKAAVGFATKLRHALFEHIESLSFSKMDQQGTSSLITRMTSDINQLQSGVNMVLRAFSAVTFYCVWRYDHGFYGGCESSINFCSSDPFVICCGFWNPFDQHSFV